MLLISRKVPPLRFYGKTPSIGVVYGTYGSTAYVELQLEALRKYNPLIPVLVHDDCSSRFKELMKLSSRYDTDLHYSTIKAGNSDLGDLCVFVQGLLWAKKKGLDILVKISRRWVTIKPWVDKLKAIAYTTQFPTYSSFCTYFKLGFRTEVIALGVQPWFSSGFVEETLATISRGKVESIVEQYIHHWAQTVIGSTCWYNKNLLSLLPIDQPFGGCMRGYGVWGHMMGESRMAPPKKQLWHDLHNPHDYARNAASLGLSLTPEAFLLN
jgi:hypothetical protein